MKWESPSIKFRNLCFLMYSLKILAKKRYLARSGVVFYQIYISQQIVKKRNLKPIGVRCAIRLKNHEVGVAH